MAEYERDDETVTSFPSGSRSASIGTLAGALAKAQGELRNAAKDSTNPHFKSRYADLASVWEACRASLAKNGLAVLQPVSADGPKVTVTTLLAHSSGEWISEALTVTAQQNTPQGVGSAITYGRRYGLAAMVGVAPDDDDAEAATRNIGEQIQRESVSPDALYGPPVDVPVFDYDQTPPERQAQASGNGAMLVISEPQSKRFYAIAKSAGWNDPELKAWLLDVWGLDSSRAIPRKKYDAIVEAAQKGPQATA